MTTVPQSSIEKYSVRSFAPSPGGKAPDPAIDYNDKLVIVERDGVQLESLTLGSPTNPAVIILPGAGATKENSIFWARDLASAGFFTIMFDLRGTGGSQKLDIEQIFGSQYTDPLEEMMRIFAKEPWKAAVEENKRRKIEGREGEGKKHLQLADLVKQAKDKTISQEDLYNPNIMEALYDYDVMAGDAVRIMDEFGIQKAHVMGLSQGGMLSQLIAMLYPDRVLTCVSAGTCYDRSGIELAYFTEEAAEFHKALKNKNVVDENGNPPFDEDTVTMQEYVDYKAGFLQEIIGGFSPEVYEEVAVREWKTGRCTAQDSAILTLAFEKWDVLGGKWERHRKQLETNKVPLYIIHGRKDPVVHYSQAEKLFSKAGTCVFEPHQHGHNFGPPDHQKRVINQTAAWMKKHATYNPDEASKAGQSVSTPGSDTYSSEVSADLGVTLDSSIVDIYNTFCSVQTVAGTNASFDLLLAKCSLQDLKGKGLSLFVELKQKLSTAGLNFRQQKLFRDLEATLHKVQKVVAKVRGAPNKRVQDVVTETIQKSSSGEHFNTILVCGAGPVGLRAACECALMGFNVHVVEKRPNFSRANILTFWDQTMADILGLGAKSYFPDLVTVGEHMFLGTRQIQACLFKTLLLLGGTVKYGMEICGLLPPNASESSKKWCGQFRPYVKNQRTKNMYAKTGEGEEGKEPTAEPTGPSTGEAVAALDAAASAVDFQKQKDYATEKGMERCEVDPAFLNASNSTDPDGAVATTHKMENIAFDAYMIAEGGWSDSTKKLGFDKMVDKFQSAFGLVINMKYNPHDMKEKSMKSKIHFALSGEWPLKKCLIQSEFIEYLKGETHFFALVVNKRNVAQDSTERVLQDIDEKDRDCIPESVLEHLRFASTQKGLLEMGVFREDKPTGHAILAPENVDVDRLHEMAREITTEMGLPSTTEFYETNPVQLFDFSRRARCVHPVRVLQCAGGEPEILGPQEFLKLDRPGAKEGVALVLPIGDALQEPNWTQGLGINRGFHTAMNQAFACLLAREKGAKDAVRESVAAQQCVTGMKWGMGNSGLAGSGGGNIGLKPVKEWNSDPRSRLPFK